jgi:hypothetical protein
MIITFRQISTASISFAAPPARLRAGSAKTVAVKIFSVKVINSSCWLKYKSGNISFMLEKNQVQFLLREIVLSSEYQQFSAIIISVGVITAWNIRFHFFFKMSYA